MEDLKDTPVKIKESLLEKVVLKITKSYGFEINELRIKQVDFTKDTKYNFLKNINLFPTLPKIQFITDLDRKSNNKLFDQIKESIYYFLFYSITNQKIKYSDYYFIVYVK